jgi:hypothetical protein
MQHGKKSSSRLSDGLVSFWFWREIFSFFVVAGAGSLPAAAAVAALPPPAVVPPVFPSIKYHHVAGK